MLNDTVIAKPVFEKVADTTLSDDTTKWHEDILQKFFEEVDYLPPNIGADIVLSSVDTNKGYGKGSVVVWFKDKKINFPIIIKDYRLSPFDVFVLRDGEEDIYMPASFENIKRVMTTTGLGELQNIWDKGQGQMNELKTPGGVYPKQLVPIDEVPADMIYPPDQPFYKRSGWVGKARKEDMEKFSAMLEKEPEIQANYIDNTGDLVTNVVDLAHSQKQTISDTDKKKDIDLNGLVKAKQALTVIDSDLFDVNTLKPVEPPSLCELRLYEFPTMEDFIERGDDMKERFLATKNGRPMVGVVLDMKEENDFTNAPTMAENLSDPDAKKKAIRQKRNQIFLSVDGSSYSTFNDWDKTGVGFYGSNIVPIGSDSIEKVMKVISANTSDDFINMNKDNRGDGSDKIFTPVKELNQGRDLDDYGVVSCGGYNQNLAVVYGAGDSFECTMFRGRYRKISVNGSPVYTGPDCAIVPANVAAIQRVRSVNDEVYRMATLGAKKIFLIPETAVVFNTEYMRDYNKEDFMRPNLPLQKVYEEANINKVAVEINPNGGYRITGEPYEGLKKISGSNGCLDTKDTITCLMVMGMEKEAAETTLKHAINRYLDSGDNRVTVYGVRGDYIDTDFNPRASIEKTAKDREIIGKMCAILRRDLTKEASAINDPEAADVVLSLNFINEDSLKGYIENIDEMRRTLSQLSQMLIASRLGLSDLDESALMKSIEGLDDVVLGLENIKLAIK